MAHQPRKKPFRFEAAALGPGAGSEMDICCLQALLGRYGYLAGPYHPGRYDQATRDAVSQFQSFYGIFPKEDGLCDRDTIELLSRPRCGVPDPPPGGRTDGGRLAPFVTAGARWERTSLSFKFINATPDLPQDRQQTILRDAFARWSAASSLRFTEIPGPGQTDLSVAFHRGSHGDGAPFDDAGGPDGNTLAHAFFPPPLGGTWAGSLHFDEFERWKERPDQPGIRLFNVALHEIGHLLGLAHSQDGGAIMYAYYGEDRNDLRPDDVAGVQHLYGAAPAAPTALSFGRAVSGHLAQKDAVAAYQVTVQNKLLFKLDGPAGADFDLYVKFGEPPGRDEGQYDAAAYGVTADELVTIPAPKAGRYFALVHAYGGSGSYTLEVDAA